MEPQCCFVLSESFMLRLVYFNRSLALIVENINKIDVALKVVVCSVGKEHFPEVF